MKNEHLIKQFMEENGIEFNKPFFWVKVVITKLSIK